MEPYIGLKYKMVSSENFDDLLIFLDYNIVQRKLGATLKPSQSLILNDDGTYSIMLTSMLVNHEFRFTPGVEFVEIKPDKIKVDALVTFDGNKATHTQKESNGRTVQHVYEFYPDKMIITTTAEGMEKVVKRHYILSK